ncbi:MAG: metal-dependent hydrolase [Novosphingobium sp.]|nr:metal-dependent hydrolase [Novosphingobium sp.]
MDNLTHSLTGWALGQTGLKRKSRKGLAALILGANMPDLDVFFGHSCWIPLATHRGVTHSLVGGWIVMPPLLAAFLWLLDRWQMRRGVAFKSGLEMHAGWLLVLCYIGVLSHPLLDLQTTYSVQLLSPFSNRWFHTDTLFIIDLFLWFTLGFGIWLSRRKERAAAWGADWHRPAIAAVSIAATYILLNGALTLAAREALIKQAGLRRSDAIYATIPPLAFWQRTLVYRDGGGNIGRVPWSPVGGLEAPAALVPDNMRDPLVRRAAWSTPEMRTFMRWSTMPMARVERLPCKVRVHFSDARFGSGRRLFGRKMRNPFLHTIVLPVAGSGCVNKGYAG